jgi:hypothetical protein
MTVFSNAIKEFSMKRPTLERSYWEWRRDLLFPFFKTKAMFIPDE